MLILFLGARSSALSLMSEAIFNHYAPEGFEAISANTEHAGLHAGALALLERNAMSTAGYFGRTWHELQEPPDVLVTVCSSIDTDACPLHLRAVLHTHWGDDDAYTVNAADAADNALLEETFDILHKRMLALFDLPLRQMRGHPDKMAAALSELGALGHTPQASSAHLQ